MKPHLTSSSTATITRHPAQAVPTHPRVALARTPAWRHKLTLTGRLDHHTVAELEDEIECLCEEGVTMLTLDLHQLDAIDSVGAKTIALLATACKMQGLHFTVIPSSPIVHRALADAASLDSLPAGDLGEAGVLHLARIGCNRPSRDTSTAIIKNL